MAKEYMKFTINEVSVSTDLYTVPAGKVFQIADMLLSVRNLSTNSSGQFAIGEDGVGQVFFGVPQGVVGASAPHVEIAHQFVGDGIPFEAGAVLSFMEITGTLIANGRISGFERDE